MKKSKLLLFAATLIMAACQPQVDRFAVSGTVAGAPDMMLYLDRMDLDRITTVDSVRLGQDGAFRFSQPAPRGCFELYRLRTGTRTIDFAVDTVCEISVTASLSDMREYLIEGSAPSLAIRDVAARQSQFIVDLKNLQQRYAGPETGVLNARTDELLAVFKSDLSNTFILSDPGSPAAYYCLFLSVNGRRIFNPYNSRQEAKTFAAVASSMDILYPQAERTMHLHNLAMKAMAKTSAPKPVSQEQIDRLRSIVVEAGIIDMELPDYKGNVHKLSDLTGKVVLLDFTAYKTDFSANYNLVLHKLYDKYSDSGFEIYQVSFDDDESFWLNASENIPWVSVRDENSLNSTILKSYNVEQLPTAFLIDREGTLVKRPDDSSELEADIEALL